ncbi:MAG TPA: hypothetical protein VF046_00220 [Gemmatimonadales bacterium]
MRTVTWAAAAVLLAVVGSSCREDPTSSTASAAGPALATAAAPLTFWQVSAGTGHSCGITIENTAYCWGANFDGELGDGSATRHPTPHAVAGGLRFRNISADEGEGHTCGVTLEYRAYCWGLNQFGELGDGTGSNRSLVPVAVAGGLRFRQVEAGVFFTCGVTYPDNRAYCWGDNLYGKLGDGSNMSAFSPVAVAGGLQFRQVTLGEWHACGITLDNRAYCWGNNRDGQIGDSSNAASRSVATAVAGGHRFRQIDAGNFHTCAVTTTDRAFCWGSGGYGQIGDGRTYRRFWPRRVAGRISFERVTAGASQSCGETTENQAYCWGQNFSGQLGDGTTTDRLMPVAVTGGLRFRQLSTAYSETCGKTSTGEAYCWGGNAFGQLGDGTTTNRTRPTPVVGPGE